LFPFGGLSSAPLPAPIRPLIKRLSSGCFPREGKITFQLVDEIRQLSIVNEGTRSTASFSITRTAATQEFLHCFVGGADGPHLSNFYGTRDSARSVMEGAYSTLSHPDEFGSREEAYAIAEAPSV
jgi:hypothetical protein